MPNCTLWEVRQGEFPQKSGMQSCCTRRHSESLRDGCWSNPNFVRLQLYFNAVGISCISSRYKELVFHLTLAENHSEATIACLLYVGYLRCRSSQHKLYLWSIATPCYHGKTFCNGLAARYYNLKSGNSSGHGYTMLRNVSRRSLCVQWINQGIIKTKVHEFRLRQKHYETIKRLILVA